jgi:perosamine synthetase
VQFHLFDPTPCVFPKSRVPVLPVLGWDSLGNSKFSGQISARWKSCCYYSRGRYALRYAYALAGVGNGGALLAPAYHCRTMLDPAIRLGAKIYLYRVGGDLTPDIDSIRALLVSREFSVKALLASHYFGFPQKLGELASLCREFDISLIEDCAHAFFAGWNSNEIGSHGHYIVSSPYKFLPCPDGGMLAINGRTMEWSGRPFVTSIRSELKAILDSVQQLLGASNEAGLEIDNLDEEIDALMAHGFVRANESRQDCLLPSVHYVLEAEEFSGSRWSRWIARNTNLSRVVERRRKNYQYWLDVAGSLPNCHLLFPELPEDCVPYMFPLYIERPEFHFYLLKNLGFPVWRWDEMAISECDVATDYRLKLIHLPCHQELSEAEMNWMLAALSKVLQWPAT